MTPLVSIVIRAKNEERWISACLREVFNQDYKNFEVILVDNESTDKTVEKARSFEIRKIISIGQYRPGQALNAGIREARGDYIVSLSAHCIPVNNRWLSSLLKNLTESGLPVAGVYGRQEPMSYSTDFDKRDMMTVFGLDRRVQEKDSFFHNANSMFPKQVWEKYPFNEDVSNIEDRMWAEEVLKAGYKIIYEPDARVFHYHGIHHDRDPNRCSSVVNILESLPNERFRLSNNHLDIEKMNIAALIPVAGPVPVVGGRPLLDYTVERARQSRYVKRVIVSTDDPATAELAKAAGAEAPFLRDAMYSQDFIDFEKVLQHSLDRIESSGIYPDLVVLMEITYPFRSPDLIDQMILHLVKGGFDTVLPARNEFNTCWIDGNGDFRRVDEGFMRREYRNPVHVGIKGLGCVTHPFFLREGRLIGNRVGLLDIDDPRMPIEVRDEKGFEMAAVLLRQWA